MDNNERSAYPHPGDFKVMRPEYTDLEDGFLVGLYHHLLHSK